VPPDSQPLCRAAAKSQLLAQKVIAEYFD